jgi:hypothetical protein
LNKKEFLKTIMDLSGLAVVGDGVKIFKSRIPNAGLGLFATREFPKDSLITAFSSPKPNLSFDQMKHLVSIDQYQHIIPITPYKWYIQGYDAKNIALLGLGAASAANDARWNGKEYSEDKELNNSVLTRLVDKDGPKFVLKATKDIHPNDEITRGYMDPVNADRNPYSTESLLFQALHGDGLFPERVTTLVPFHETLEKRIQINPIREDTQTTQEVPTNSDKSQSLNTDDEEDLTTEEPSYTESSDNEKKREGFVNLEMESSEHEMSNQSEYENDDAELYYLQPIYYEIDEANQWQTCVGIVGTIELRDDIVGKQSSRGKVFIRLEYLGTPLEIYSWIDPDIESIHKRCGQFVTRDSTEHLYLLFSQSKLLMVSTSEELVHKVRRAYENKAIFDKLEDSAVTSFFGAPESPFFIPTTNVIVSKYPEIRVVSKQPKQPLVGYEEQHSLPTSQATVQHNFEAPETIVSSASNDEVIVSPPELSEQAKKRVRVGLTVILRANTVTDVAAGNYTDVIAVKEFQTLLEAREYFISKLLIPKIISLPGCRECVPVFNDITYVGTIQNMANIKQRFPIAFKLVFPPVYGFSMDKKVYVGLNPYHVEPSLVIYGNAEELRKAFFETTLIKSANYKEYVGKDGGRLIALSARPQTDPGKALFLSKNYVPAPALVNFPQLGMVQLDTPNYQFMDTLVNNSLIHFIGNRFLIEHIVVGQRDYLASYMKHIFPGQEVLAKQLSPDFNSYRIGEEEYISQTVTLRFETKGPKLYMMITTMLTGLLFVNHLSTNITELRKIADVKFSIPEGIRPAAGGEGFQYIHESVLNIIPIGQTGRLVHPIGTESIYRYFTDSGFNFYYTQ